MVHVAMHAIVVLHLRRRAVGTIGVRFGAVRHGAGLQSQIQPDGNEQTQGATAKGLLLVSDSGELAQVIVSATISAVSRNRRNQPIGNTTCASSAWITRLQLRTATPC